MATDGSRFLRGNGKLVTRRIEVAHFSSLRLSNAFAADISPAEACSILLIADSNLIERVRAGVRESTLELSLERGIHVSRGTLRALVRLPTLERVDLFDASAARVEGVGSTPVFAASLTDASTLQGTLNVEHVELRLSGASRARLEGTATTALLRATDASELQLSGLRIGTVCVEIGSASLGDVHITGRLTEASISGASSLRVRGNPALGHLARSGAANLRMS